MRVLVIDGNAKDRSNTSLVLAGEKLELTDSGEEGVDLAKLYDFDLITLDLVLPDITGFEAIRRIRAANIKTPILILSGMSLVTDIVKALGLGADDYLTKPFHPEELIARLHALVRRSKGLAASVITTGNLSLDLTSKTATIDGNALHLTGKEYAMLELLALRKGTTLSKDTFLTHLYGGMDEPERKIVDVFICKLRKKLAAMNGHPIETVWGRGYVLRDPDSKSASMAAEVADLADDPPTGYVPDQTYSKFKDSEINRRRGGVRIAIPAT